MRYLAASAFCLMVVSNGAAFAQAGSATAPKPAARIQPDAVSAADVASGDNGKAVADYDQAIQRDASFSDAFSGRAYAKLRQRQYEGAIADYGEAIRLAPNNAYYRVQRGHAYASKGDMEQAIADFNAAIALKPDYAEAFAARGDIRRMRKDYIHALADMDAAIQYDPSGPMTAFYYGNRGSAYSDVHNYERAMSDFAASLRLKPGLANALNARCYTRAVANREIEAAIADCDTALAAPQNGIGIKAAILDSRGLAHLRKGELEKSLADYDASLALMPRAGTLYGRGLVKTRMGRAGEGAKDIADALKMDSKAGDAMTEAGLKP